jgi:hypothetical protein
MRILKAFPMLLCAIVLSALLAPGVKADPRNKETVVTFNDPVEIPGQVLDPGTYVFKLADSTDRNVVQIWTADQDNVVATINTVPDYQLQPKDKSYFKLDTLSGEQAATLDSWFFAGETSGRQFVYPQYPTNDVAANIDTAQ